MDSIDNPVLRAAEKRNPRLLAKPGKTPRLSRDGRYEAWDANHSMREEFRRLLDPGILRNNDKKDAAEALKFMNRATEKILRDPNNPRYRRLNINFEGMKEHVMSRKGTVEFLQKMGFREQVEDNDTRLVLNPERMDTFRVGAQCLDEVIKNQVQAIDDAERLKRQEAANQKAAVTKVKNAIRNDRQRVAARVERERSTGERGSTQGEANSAEPPVEEMSQLKIKTLSDCS